MVWFETEFKSPGEGDWQAGNVYSHISEIMKSVSLAAIFWCILIPSSETSKNLHDVRSGENKVECLDKGLINCLYVVDPMLVPSHDVEEYCQLCDCKSVESSDTAIKIILIVFLLVFVIILFFNIVLTIVKHFSHKPDAYTNSLHNEEESEVTLMLFNQVLF
ncbi:TMEM9: Transmembrane protein 9 [Crotalus adamanteus]|uniref:TMEM9: Transmembrane protein 9 n=1 Tax=Crotalus adamanteus TaxID=8729 RepID=A0AAW1BT85_CROAD